MKTLLTALKIFLFFTLLTGIVYPLAITGINQLAFPKKANGSLIISEAGIIGSELIGQTFDSSIYFSSRPSAISYNPQPSGGSNLGLSTPKLMEQVNERKTTFIKDNELDSLVAVPSEMFFASASGLDPHISPEAALLQVNRIAKARNFDEVYKEKLIKLIENHTEKPQFLVFGVVRVNVLLLNLEIDKIK